jgi:hypothetical protein
VHQAHLVQVLVHRETPVGGQAGEAVGCGHWRAVPIAGFCNFLNASISIATYVHTTGT